MVCLALTFGSRRFHECYIILISVIQQFDVRKARVHLHKRIRKTARYDADVHTTHAAREIRNAYTLARIPDETGLFELTGCRWGN
jgi:hypothetical protein